LNYIIWQPSAILDLLDAYWDHLPATHDGHLVVSIVLQKLVEIDAVVSILWISEYFEFGLKKPIHARKIGVSEQFDHQNEE